MHKWIALLGMALSAGVGFSGVYAILAPDEAVAFARSTLGQFGLVGCDIKGNVSLESGERIYHLPGQRYYDQTRIRPEYGERYFCTEDDALSAGWRRSGV